MDLLYSRTVQFKKQYILSLNLHTHEHIYISLRFAFIYFLFKCFVLLLSLSATISSVIIKGPYYLVYTLHMYAHVRAHSQLMTSPPADPLTLIRATKRQIAAAGQ